MLEPLEAAEINRSSLRANDPCKRSEMNLRVLEFMEKAKQPTLDSPGRPSKEIRLLAAKLIFEEARETIEAFGCRIVSKPGVGLEVIALTDESFNLKDAVDGCIDTQYVCHWGLNAMGVADELPTLEVCDANDRKFAEGHWIDSNGKLRKPPGWVGPDIAGAIEAQKNWKGDL